MLSIVDYNMVRIGGVLYLYEEIINDWEKLRNDYSGCSVICAGSVNDIDAPMEVGEVDICTVVG